ncbi:MAG: recombinase family protein [Pseudomonadales bacterium]|jgi:DNA invertase Pin-like site-specific DNA recombinase|nr:recombinase family protein [Pseudomonadales bacterium]MDP7596911.1 recombinase family protein [Pseudomonadales bacterium]HJN51736.1 recombinase family protein [Pseudomonadales bacterium]|tara:strand:- start:825 stop:1373 length:549 start_codon:yes stop_codon:yes gene_type:complete
MLIGYSRVLEDDKTRRRQTRALNAAKCKKIVKDKMNKDGSPANSLDDVLSELKKGDTLVVWRLDCLAGSLEELLAVVTRINRLKANLNSIVDDFSVTPRTAKSMQHTLAALNDFQYALIKQRTIHGLRAARAKGRVGGRPRKLGPSQIREAKNLLKKANVTKAEVAVRLGVSRVTLNKALVQ